MQGGGRNRSRAAWALVADHQRDSTRGVDGSARADESPAPLPAVPRRVGWLHFWNDFTLDFVTPFLAFSVPVAWLGAMEGAADALGQGLKLVTGRASDASGRRVPWVRAGYAANAIARPLAMVGVLILQPALIVACRIGDRIGKGLRGSASDALIADWTDDRQRARAYARMRVMDHLGAALGAAAAVAVTWWAVGDAQRLDPARHGWIVAVLAVPMLAMLWLCRGLADRAPAPKPAAERPWWPRDPALRAPLGLIAVASLAAKINPVLILAVVAGWTEAGQEGWALWQGALAWMVLSLAQAGAAEVAGRLTDRVGPRAFLVAGWLVGAALFAGLALADGWLRTGIALGYAILAGFTEGAEKTCVAALAPKAERATAFGALGILVAIAMLLGNTAVGQGLHRHGATAVFLVAALVLALAALALAATGRTRRTG